MNSMPRSRNRAGAQGELGPRHIEREMLHATTFPWRMPPGVLPGLVGEHGEQAAIAWVKVQVIFIRGSGAREGRRQQVF